MPFYKKLLSYFYPIPIRRLQGGFNDYLEIILYSNRVQLATRDALYSDGDRYTPALTTVKALKEHLPAMHRVLVLGAGLGSMVHVLRSKGFDPHFTLVEKDKVVLQLAMEFMNEECSLRVEPVCNDAALFMKKNTALYDLIFLDVFMGRVVPEFVFSSEFLHQCRNSMATGGHLAFNYIVNDKQEWENVQHTFATVFPEHSIIKSGINRILIGK